MEQPSVDLKSLHALVAVFTRLVETGISCSLKHISQNGQSKLLLMAETAVPILQKKRRRRRKRRGRDQERMKRFIAKKKEDLENQTQKTVEQPLLLGLPTVELGGMDILHSNLQQEGRERPLPSILQQGDEDGDSPILLNPSPRRRRQRLNLSPIFQLDGDDSQPGPLSVEKVIKEIPFKEELEEFKKSLELRQDEMVERLALFAAKAWRKDVI